MTMTALPTLGSMTTDRRKTAKKSPGKHASPAGAFRKGEEVRDSMSLIALLLFVI